MRQRSCYGQLHDHLLGVITYQLIMIICVYVITIMVIMRTDIFCDLYGDYVLIYVTICRYILLV